MSQVFAVRGLFPPEIDCEDGAPPLTPATRTATPPNLPSQSLSFFFSVAVIVASGCYRRGAN